MILLTATNQSLEATTTGAVVTAFQTAYADHDAVTPAFTPGSSQGSITTATTTTLVSAPASSIERQVKAFSIHNSHGSSSQTVTVQKNVASTLYILIVIALAAGETLLYTEVAGFQVFDALGRLKVRVAVVAGIPGLRQRVGFMTAGLVSVKSLTSTTSFAYYFGKAPTAMTAMQVRMRVTTAYGNDGSTPWAEVAIATGAPSLAANPSLTVVGYLNVASIINSTGQVSVTVPVSGGQAINEGDDIWVIVACKATTVAVLRADSIADDLQAGYQVAATTTQPSLIVGTPTTFTIEGATTLAPWLTVTP